MNNLEQARAAQITLLEKFRNLISGVGITSRSGKFGLKVNVSTDRDKVLIPNEIEGIPIFEVQVVRGVRMLNASGGE